MVVPDDPIPDRANSTDKGLTSLAVSSDDAEPVSDNEYQVASMVSSVQIGLGNMAICKHGSADDTFKAMTRNCKQLFIFMQDFLPIA